MKKIFTHTLLVLGIGIVFSSSAQITINRSDLGNLVGKVHINANDTSNLNLISPGTAGPNQTWNLSGLGNDTKDTLVFSSTSTAGSCTNAFPTANLALNQGTTTTFIHESNALVELVGYCNQEAPGGLGSIPLTPSRKVITFPFTYNTSFSGESAIRFTIPNDPPPPDSFRFVSKTVYSVLVDGWGQVTTPSGTYAALRKKTIAHIHDSSFVLVAGNWIPTGEPTIDTTVEYEWYGQNNLFIANIQQDGHGVTTDASYLLSTTTEVKDVKKNELTSTIFPNPSNGKFTIRSAGQSNRSIEIFNSMGARVASLSMSLDETDLDLSALPVGIYYLKIKEGARMESHKIRIE